MQNLHRRHHTSKAKHRTFTANIKQALQASRHARGRVYNWHRHRQRMTDSSSPVGSSSGFSSGREEEITSSGLGSRFWVTTSIYLNAMVVLHHINRSIGPYAIEHLCETGVVPSVRCPGCGVKGAVSGLRCPGCGVRVAVSGVRCLGCPGCPGCGVGCGVRGPGCSVLGAVSEA